MDNEARHVTARTAAATAAATAASAARRNGRTRGATACDALSQRLGNLKVPTSNYLTQPLAKSNELLTQYFVSLNLRDIIVLYIKH